MTSKGTNRHGWIQLLADIVQDGEHMGEYELQGETSSFGRTGFGGDLTTARATEAHSFTD